MPNSDNTYGTFNKQTNIYSQALGDAVTDEWGVTDTPTEVTFATVDEAKAWFFTTDALTMFDECCTTLQWALVGNTKLKATFDFGTKGTASILESDDWAEQFKSRKTALIAANNFWKGSDRSGVTLESSTDHLF